MQTGMGMQQYKLSDEFIQIQPVSGLTHSRQDEYNIGAIMTTRSRMAITSRQEDTQSNRLSNLQDSEEDTKTLQAVRKTPLTQSSTNLNAAHQSDSSHSSDSSSDANSSCKTPIEVNKRLRFTRQTESSVLMPNKHIVCLTGFYLAGSTLKALQLSRDQCEKYLKDLNCQEVNGISESVTLLVVVCVATEKYKIARQKRHPIKCVTVQWLIDSHAAGECKRPSDYQIPSIFYRTVVHVVGFDSEKANRIIDVIKREGGEAALGKPDSTHNFNCDVIIAADSCVQRLFLLEKAYEIPIVNLEWLDNCLAEKVCLFPTDYALNYHQMEESNPKDTQKKLDNLNIRLNGILQTDLMDQSLDLLAHTIIYLPESLEGKLASCLKKCITAFGGLYLVTISPLATHIVCPAITEEQYNQLQVYGTITHIVRVDWLTDCIFVSKRLKQRDYYIRSFKQPSKSIGSEQSVSNNQSHFSNFMKLTNSNSQLPSLTRIKSQGSLHFKVPCVTNIFGGKMFYFDPKQQKQSEIKRLVDKIKANGGEVYDHRSTSFKNCYVVLKDSKENPTILKRIEHYSKRILKVISPRWIEASLLEKKCQPLQFDKLGIFEPFNFVTPLSELRKYKIEVVALDEATTLQLRQLLSVIGLTNLQPKAEQLTHCLCGEDWSKCDRLRSISMRNNSFKMLRIQWLHESVKEGKLLPEGPYVMSRDQPKDDQETTSQQGLAITAQIESSREAQFKC